MRSPAGARARRRPGSASSCARTAARSCGPAPRTSAHVLDNLIDNALRYAPAGSEVRVETGGARRQRDARRRGRRPGHPAGGARPRLRTVLPRLDGPQRRPRDRPRACDRRRAGAALGRRGPAARRAGNPRGSGVPARACRILTKPLPALRTRAASVEAWDGWDSSRSPRSGSRSRRASGSRSTRPPGARSSRPR